MMIRSFLVLVVVVLGLAQAQTGNPTTNTLNAHIQAQAAKSPFQLVVPNHYRYLQQLDSLARKLAKALLWLGGAILFIGFLKRHYDLWLLEHEPAYLSLWLITGFYAALLSATYGTGGKLDFRGLMLDQWKHAYAWSSATFAPDLRIKLAEANNSMGVAIARIVEVGGMVVGARVGWSTATAYRGFRNPAMTGQLALEGSAGKAALLAGKDAAVGVLGRAGASALRYFGLVNQYLYPLLAGYSLTILLSGLAVILAAYLLPIGVGALIWGFPNILINCLSVFLTALLVVAFLPPLAVMALDIAFVQSMQTVEQMTEVLDTASQRAMQLTQDVVSQMRGASIAEIENCLNAVAGNPEALNTEVCRTSHVRTLEEKVWDTAREVFERIWQPVDALLAPVRDVLIRILGSLVMLLIGLLMAVAFIMQVPGIISGVIGAGMGSATSMWRGMRLWR